MVMTRLPTTPQIYKKLKSFSLINDNPNQTNKPTNQPKTI
jgi:hypothetical protein